MATYETPQGGWNLFASVLQEILAAHGLGLGHLDDRAHIHREKVRRLQLSLKIPKSFPVLNIDEMEQVITVFQLNRNEKIRLRAAKHFPSNDCFTPESKRFELPLPLCSSSIERVCSSR